jgi:hypothetical protein
MALAMAASSNRFCPVPPRSFWGIEIENRVPFGEELTLIDP